MNHSRSHSDDESKEFTLEDKTFDLTVRKMKAKIYPSQVPRHVSEMSKHTEYEENKMIPHIFTKYEE